MRTARYTIPLVQRHSYDRNGAANERKRFQRFVRTCESLHSDGFEYQVAFRGGEMDLTAIITGTAHGSLAVKRKPIKRVAFTIPAKLTLEAIRKLAAKAESDLEARREHSARALKFDAPEWKRFDALLYAAVLDGGFDADETLRENLAAAWEEIADPEIYQHGAILSAIKGMAIDGLLWELAQADTPYRNAGFCNPGSLYSSYTRNFDNVKQARAWYQRNTNIESAERNAAREFLETDYAEMLQAERDHWREMELLSGQRDRFRPGADLESVDDELAA